MQAVIFDFDGVIVDSERYWPEVENAVYSRIAPGWTEANHRDIVAMGFADLRHYLAEHFGMDISDAEFEQHVCSMADDVYSRCTLNPGIEELIHRAQEATGTLAIASSSRREWIMAALDHFGLAGAFPVIVTSEGFPKGEGKPHPAIYRKTAGALDVEPAECVVIEDAANGVKAAKAAGMECIGYRNGYNDDQNLSLADTVVEHLDEIRFS